ncbi:MAG TPA: cytochrome c3 family protein [Nitrospirota bacterium]
MRTGPGKMKGMCMAAGALFFACALIITAPAYAQEKRPPKAKAGVKKAAAAEPQEKNKFKLKPGGQAAICANCHVTFTEKLQSRFVHTPVKSGQCSGCHNPHASSYGKLLAADTSKICATCHAAMIPDKAVSTHEVVSEGNCMKCHDPHASGNKAQLLKAGNELCFGCHKDVGDAVTKAKFKHSPVEKGCLTCHSPHASGKADFLLQDSVPALCLKCHKTDGPAFSKQHMNYPVAKANCVSCHNPHGSDNGGILYNTVHKPVASRMCNQCHDQPGSQKPFALKKAGYELCRGCHSTLVNEALSKNRVHWPLLSKEGCLSCHSPHASTEKKLLKGTLAGVCGECHADSIARQERSQTKHEPVNEGQCTLCHAPHASDQIFLLQKPSVVETCGICHDWQKHSSHPIGEKVIDPRNKNLTLDCLSCHRSHGTEYKHFLYFGTTSEMCTQCHVQYKR